MCGRFTLTVDKISAYPVSTLVNKPGNGPSRMCRTSVLIDNS